MGISDSGINVCSVSPQAYFGKDRSISRSEARALQGRLESTEIREEAWFRSDGVTASRSEHDCAPHTENQELLE